MTELTGTTTAAPGGNVLINRATDINAMGKISNFPDKIFPKLETPSNTLPEATIGRDKSNISFGNSPEDKADYSVACS